MVDARYISRPLAENKPAEVGAWFAPRRYGLGAGLPLRWQGLALTGSYVALLPLINLLDDSGDWRLRASAFALFLAATVTFATVAARRTRGGRRWRWGARD